MLVCAETVSNPVGLPQGFHFRLALRMKQTSGIFWYEGVVQWVYDQGGQVHGLNKYSRLKFEHVAALNQTEQYKVASQTQVLENRWPVHAGENRFIK